VKVGHDYGGGGARAPDRRRGHLDQLACPRSGGERRRCSTWALPLHGDGGAVCIDRAAFGVDGGGVRAEGWLLGEVKFEEVQVMTCLSSSHEIGLGAANVYCAPLPVVNLVLEKMSGDEGSGLQT
jgi:hypothetical protein